jgi:hypothetical protein
MPVLNGKERLKKDQEILLIILKDKVECLSVVSCLSRVYLQILNFWK